MSTSVEATMQNQLNLKRYDTTNLIWPILADFTLYKTSCHLGNIGQNSIEYKLLSFDFLAK